MGLSKYKLGELLELSEDRNSELKYNVDDVKGISIQKIFIETKADMSGVSLQPYYLVKPDDFAYVTVTSRNGEKITMAHNDSNAVYIVSSSYVVFHVLRTDILDSDYLFIYFNRPEFDRYARFNSWGSARETFLWNDMCDIEITLPPLPVQQKYVDVYNAMLANQRAYERGLDDLKLVCDAYIENLRQTASQRLLGDLIERKNERNEGQEITHVVGLSTKKQFREAQSRVDRDNLSNYKIVHPYEFVFVPTTDTWKVLAVTFNAYDEDVVVSPIYEVFSIAMEQILPEYLSLWFGRTEFDRYARYHSWGSARENFTFDDMCEVKIPIPDISIQRDIASIYNVYTARKQINERLKAQVRDICPILIKGSLEEATE